jgi:hypothetical protein
MDMDRGADDPIDAIRCGRLDRKFAAPGLKKHGEPIRDHSDGWDLISQPGFKHLGVGDGRFPKSKQSPDLSPMTFPGSAGRIVLLMIAGMHAKLSSHQRHGLTSISAGFLGNRPCAR